MIRVHVLVEGFTEETFIRDVLGPALWAHQVSISAKVVATRRTKAGLQFKGGVTSYQRVAFQIRELLKDGDVRMVTTMLDLHRLPEEFPGWRSCTDDAGASRATYLEQAFKDDIDDPRFRPYFSVHEFEALVFADLDACKDVFQHGWVVEKLQKERAGFSSPEDINQRPETSPSKRILRAFPRYRKLTDGPAAVKRIGLPRLRAECPHFDAWVSDLERVGQPASPPRDD